MTKLEYGQFVKIYTSYWRYQFDDLAIRTWENVLIGLNYQTIEKTLISLAKSEQYPPTIKVIIDRYEEIKRNEEAAQRQREIEQYEKSLKLTVAGQYQCPICDNAGDFIYQKQRNGYNYDFYCRCSCARGKNLNKWSKYQITKDMLWNNPQTNKEENLYICDIEDVFSAEEIELIKIKNSEVYKNPRSFNTQKAIENITSNMVI